MEGITSLGDSRSLEKVQWKDGLLGSSNTAGGGLRGGGPGPGLGK